MVNEQTITFDQDGFFFTKVISYKAAICGLIIYHPDMGAIESDPVGFVSTVYPTISFEANEIQQSIKEGVISKGIISDSLTYMLINSSYETVQDYYNKEE